MRYSRLNFIPDDAHELLVVSSSIALGTQFPRLANVNIRRMSSGSRSYQQAVPGVKAWAGHGEAREECDGINFELHYDLGLFECE